MNPLLDTSRCTHCGNDIYEDDGSWTHFEFNQRRCYPDEITGIEAELVAEPGAIETECLDLFEHFDTWAESRGER